MVILRREPKNLEGVIACIDEILRPALGGTQNNSGNHSMGCRTATKEDFMSKG